MSITVAFLAPHTGRHAAAVAMPLAAMASRFLRAFRPSPPEGGRADPQPPRGAALLQDQRPELRVCCLTAMNEPHGGRCCADTVRTRPDGAITVEPDGSVTVRPVNGRNLGTRPRWYLDVSTLPRRKPMTDRQPWQTMQQPVLPEPGQAGPARAWDPGDGLDSPVALARPYVPEAAYPCCKHCEGFTCDRPYHPTPCDEDGCNG